MFARDILQLKSHALPTIVRKDPDATSISTAQANGSSKWPELFSRPDKAENEHEQHAE